MKLSVSNIAWPAECDREAFTTISGHGIGALEVAPTRIWPQWEGMTVEAAGLLFDLLRSQSLQVSSMQSILFQKQYQLFGSETDRSDMFDHLRRCADIAARLEAQHLVFGAPKNRDRGSLSEEDALEVAAEFFAKVGSYFASLGVCLGFEANPPQYSCNFASNSALAAKLVRRVNSPGFRLHLDSACMQLAGDDPAATIRENADILCHFHVSEPFLGGFESPVVPHEIIAGALREVDYCGWVALEMRASDQPLPSLDTAVQFLRNTYGDVK